MSTATDRDLFSYHNGEKPVFGDPLYLNRALHGSMAGEVNKYLRRTDPAANDPGAVLHAWGKLITATREAFRLVPFNPETGAGATDADAIRVIRDFLAFLSKKKVSSASRTTCQPSTVPMS